MVRLDELKHEVRTRRRASAVLAAAVVLIVVSVSWFAASRLGGSDDAVVTPVKTVAPSPGAQPTAAGPLEPGRYAIPIHGPVDLHVEVTVAGADWAYADYVGLSRANPDTGLLFWHVDHVYADPCSDKNTVLADGHSPAELLAALDAQQGTRLGTQTDTTVGGHPAVRVDLVLTDAGADSCKLWADSSGFYRPGGDGTVPLWVVDVDGTTVLIDVHTVGLDPETEAVIDSATFATS